MTTPTRDRSGLFTILVGLASLGVRQGLWAGMFIRPGRAFDAFWVTVHARGAEVTIALALAAAVVAFLWLRPRRDLVIGSAALVVLLAFEAFIGGEVYDNQWLTAVHIPLALALMGLAVWLPLRARSRSAGRQRPGVVAGGEGEDAAVGQRHRRRAVAGDRVGERAGQARPADVDPQLPHVGQRAREPGHRGAARRWRRPARPATYGTGSVPGTPCVRWRSRPGCRSRTT